MTLAVRSNDFGGWKSRDLSPVGPSTFFLTLPTSSSRVLLEPVGARLATLKPQFTFYDPGAHRKTRPMLQ